MFFKKKPEEVSTQHKKSLAQEGLTQEGSLGIIKKRKKEKRIAPESKGELGPGG